MKVIDVEQGTHEWHKLRQGVVTGTKLARAVGSPKVQETLRYELIAERMTEVQIDDLNTDVVVRGRELEPVALRAVNDQYGGIFTTAGMLEGDIEGFRFSPDAVTYSDAGIVGGLEIKCPNSKTHIKYLIDRGVPKEYRHQVLAPFVMSDQVESWHFASFDDRNYEKPLFIKRVLRGDVEKEVKEMRVKLIEFLASVEEAHEKLTF